MKAILVYQQKVCTNYFIKMIQDVLRDRNIETECMDITGYKSDDLMIYLKNVLTEIIICVDMAGFQYKTLQEDSFYNILTAKQLHFLSARNELDEYEQENFALNLYMAAPQKECGNAELTGRTNIPHMIKHPDYEKKKGVIIYSESNKKIIKEIIALFFYNLR